MQQHTIAAAFLFEGIGLHSGRHARVNVRPAPPGHGIRFYRLDLPKGIEIPLRPELVRRTARQTTVGLSDVACVMTVEHLVSALYGMGVHNAKIEIEGSEIPILDGSALPFCRLIRKAGIVSQVEPLVPFVLQETVHVSAGGSTLVAVPWNGFKLSVTFANDYGHPALSHQYFEWEGPDAERYMTEVAPSRTFGRMQDVEALRSQGLIQGATMDACIVLDEQRIVTPLRFADEFVRHKALDLLGDLAPAGPLYAHIIAIRPSHTLNNDLCNRIEQLRRRHFSDQPLSEEVLS